VELAAGAEEQPDADRDHLVSSEESVVARR
jgi:hypothetical protein